MIVGGARGADEMALTWAVNRGFPATVVKAEWDKFGKSAGYKRNEKMARMKPDFVIAFPGGRGTAHMVDIAGKHDITVIHAGRVARSANREKIGAPDVRTSAIG